MATRNEPMMDYKTKAFLWEKAGDMAMTPFMQKKYPDFEERMEAAWAFVVRKWEEGLYEYED